MSDEHEDRAGPARSDPELVARAVGGDKTALTLLLTQWVVFNQQKFFHAKPFAVTWFAFVIVALGAAFLKWICIGLVEESGFTPFGDLFTAYLITVAVYPVIAWLFSKAQTGLLDEL